MNMQSLALFSLVTIAIGGLGWVFVYPHLSGERKAEQRKLSVARSEPVARTTVPSDSGVRTDIGRDVGVRNEVGGVPRDGVVVSGDGSSAGTPRGGYVTTAPGYNTRSARPYPYAGSIDPATGGVVLNFDEKYWPPVVQGQAFPPQHMWTD